VDVVTNKIDIKK